MKPLVSILIPAYNAQDFIAQTVECALTQTWPRKEIIVVDDGSRDGTLEIARRYEPRGVTVVSQKNQGAAATRNNAYARCSGDYIQWLDADDLISPEKIEKQIEAASHCATRRPLLSSPWARFIYRESKARFIPTALWQNLSVLEWMTLKMEQNLYMQTATWLVSRELSEAAGPWDTRLLSDDDGEYFARVLMASGGVLFVPGVKTFYRMSGPGCLNYIGRSDRKMEAQLLSMRINIGYIRSLSDDARVRAACITYLQNWLPTFYPERPDLVEESMQLARELGGTLRIPTMTWKYAWIQKLFGWTVARRAQMFYNERKASVLTYWDKTLSHLEKRALTAE